MERDAEAVLAGTIAVRTGRDIFKTATSQPVPIALHICNSGEAGAVLFLLRRSDGPWQFDCVMAQRTPSGGWFANGMNGSTTGRLVPVGPPGIVLVCGTWLDDDRSYYAAVGNSAPGLVDCTLDGEHIAQVEVPAHGIFLVSTAVPEDSDPPKFDLRQVP